MLKIYTKKNCNSSKKAILWLDNFEIYHEHLMITQISRKDFFKILSLTENGVDDLLIKSISKRKGELKIINQMTVGEAWIFLKMNPELCRSPILIENNKILIGWYIENIRQFLSSSYRKNKRMMNSNCEV